jgi:hypothetical protein
MPRLIALRKTCHCADLKLIDIGAITQLYKALLGETAIA